MQTFKLAELFEEDKIMVNAVQIPGVKHSKSSLHKMGFATRLNGSLMNPYLPKPEVIADSYFNICTNEKFNNTSCKLIDRKGKYVEAPKFAYKLENIETKSTTT